MISVLIWLTNIIKFEMIAKLLIISKKIIKNHFHLNERIIELHDIAPKEFWGAQDAHLETIKILSQAKNSGARNDTKSFW